MGKHIRLSKTECATLIDRFAANQIVTEQLKLRSECAVYRIDLTPESVILKLWNRPGIRGVVRRCVGSSPAQKEMRAVRLLQKTGVSVPGIVGFHRVTIDNFPWTDAVFFEDIGNCEKAMNYVKYLLARQEEDDLAKFLDSIIEMTDSLIRGGVVDLDHNFNNIVATPDGKAVRLDFERAYRSYLRWFPTVYYGRMLGFLISSYLFAVQPNVERATDFGKKLILRTKPPTRVLRATQRYIDNTMEWQKRRRGVNTRFTLPD